MSYRRFFKTKTVKRKDEKEKNIILLSDNAPEELKEFVKKVHMDYFEKSFPNDWIYEEISRAFDDIESYDDIDAFIYEAEADCYYQDLQAWTNNHFAPRFIDEVIDEGVKGYYHQIATGQVAAIQTIRQAVIDFLEL